jgi:type II secretory pathway pseudopilin PulG
MSSSANLGVAVAAWVVAGALAAALSAVAFAVASRRRAGEAMDRLQALETALDEFCTALRARLLVERSRSRGWLGESDSEADSSQEPAGGDQRQERPGVLTQAASRR